MYGNLAGITNDGKKVLQDWPEILNGCSYSLHNLKDSDVFGQNLKFSQSGSKNKRFQSCSQLRPDDFDQIEAVPLGPEEERLLEEPDSKIGANEDFLTVEGSNEDSPNTPSDQPVSDQPVSNPVLPQQQSTMTMTSTGQTSNDQNDLFDISQSRCDLFWIFKSSVVSIDQPREHSPVWPDGAIYWTLGKFFKPLATIR